jgi:hypothetical protein
MTVNELIQQLKNYPGDMRVLTLGYEGGLNEVGVYSDSIVFNYNHNDAWFYGPHEYAKYVDSNGDTGTECVIVMRGK